MTTSAFKSTSRRPSTSSSSSTTANNKQQLQKSKNSTQKAPPRRSRSVSSFSRTHLDTTSEFQNKTDNPLFWVEGSPNSQEDFDGVILSDSKIPKFIGVNNLKGSSDFSGESRRGRSASRNSGGDSKISGGSGEVRKSVGRSLSRVDTARRRRSLSRGHYGNSECELEQENELLKFRSKSKIISDANCSLHEGKDKPARSASDLSEILKGRNTWSSQHPFVKTSDDSASNLSGSQIPCWDDGTPTSYFSESEEKTIKPIPEEIKFQINPMKVDNEKTGEILETVRSEVRQAISDMQNDFKNAMRRSNSDVVHSSFVSDVTPEQENLNTVGLVQDFREEFERELEECEERTRKLRAELASEEHLEIELNQILNDIVPEPRTPVVQKPRAVGKASYERKKMSKHLEEEALAYFDECVSISTFDDSEFSSLEDLHNMVGVDDPGSEIVDLESQDVTRGNAVVRWNEASGAEFRNSQNNSATKPQCAFGSTPADTISLEKDIRNYIKSFCKDSGLEKSISPVVRVSHQSTESYNCEVPMEKLLLDRLTFRSRIESGSMLLCGAGFNVTLAPFSSLL